MVLMYLYLPKKKKFDNVNNFNIIINQFCATSASNKIPYEFKLPIASYKFYLTSINISLYSSLAVLISLSKFAIASAYESSDFIFKMNF